MKGEIKGITVQWMHVVVLELKLTGVKCCCCCHDLQHMLEFARLTSHSPDQMCRSWKHLVRSKQKAG